MLAGDAIASLDENGERITGDGLLIVFNAHHDPVDFHLPGPGAGRQWILELDTFDDALAPHPVEGAESPAHRTQLVGAEAASVSVARASLNFGARFSRDSIIVI